MLFYIDMKTFILTFLVVTVIVLIAVFLLGFKVWLFKDGKFPNIHIGSSKALRDQGISCATTQDAEAQKTTSKFELSKIIKEIDEK